MTFVDDVVTSMPNTLKEHVSHYLRTGHCDINAYVCWPGNDVIECMRRAKAALRSARIDSVHTQFVAAPPTGWRVFHKYRMPPASRAPVTRKLRWRPLSAYPSRLRQRTAHTSNTRRLPWPLPGRGTWPTFQACRHSDLVRVPMQGAQVETRTASTPPRKTTQIQSGMPSQRALSISIIELCSCCETRNIETRNI